MPEVDHTIISINNLLLTFKCSVLSLSDCCALSALTLVLFSMLNLNTLFFFAVEELSTIKDLG